MARRRMAKRTLLAGAAAGLVTLSGAGAFAADGKITYLATYGSPDRPMVLAASDRGVGLIGADHKLFRAYSHSRTGRAGVQQGYLWVEDVDDDKRAEIIAAGKPSFVIDDNGDPLWGMLEGCDQFFVGDFVDRKTPEIFCRGPKGMSVWSMDGQKYFEWQGKGYSIRDCYADDFDTDGKFEVQCDFGKEKHLFFDLEYAEPEERDGAATTTSGNPGVDESESRGHASGSDFRFAGKTVTLRQDGGEVTVMAGAGPMFTVKARGTIHSATVADLDGNGSEELYLGGTDQVLIVNDKGEILGDIALVPGKTRRDARVTLRGASANALQDSDRDSVRATIESGGLDSVRKCYGDRMGRDQFTRVGLMVFELKVDNKGKATDATMRHSDLRNKDLEKCVADRLKAIKFSPATEGSGLVNVQLVFDFVDSP